MNIKIEKPPIWERAHREFEIDDSRTIYTYGDTIYNPANTYISPEVLEHEKVHMRQQGAFVGGPKAWWERYFDDMSFRVSQEAEAYATQLKAYEMRERDRNKQTKYLYEIAGFLASPMYGVDMKHSDAMGLIRAFRSQLGW
jgi:hypothetical protein